MIRIHIHSDQKLPERVVYDTSLPTTIPAENANKDTSATVLATCRRLRQGPDAGGICAIATVRFRKAATEAAATQNCKESREADGLAGATTAIWLAWP
jgi:hypothetical protein